MSILNFLSLPLYLMFSALNTLNFVHTDSTSVDNEDKFWIYYASWEDWGRSSKNCAGWGFCNYEDCWFCDVPGLTVKHQGLVKIDEDTKKGYLTIELDLSEDVQRNAIKEKATFYIDKDIVNKKTILHQGKYSFDSSVGKLGGYKIDISMK